MARFKSLTMGGTVIMGAHTWHSIGRPLAGRTVIVLSHNGGAAGGHGGDVLIAHSLESALDMARRIARPVWIAGGERVYREALPLCGKLFLTEVMDKADGDTHFPPFNKGLYTIEVGEMQEGGTCGGKSVRYRFVTYTRR